MENGLWYSDPVPLPELQLIQRIRRQAESRRRAKKFADVLTGIGDDCAILRGDSRFDLLVTTDFSIEGVHFRREWHPPESVGHRCLARGLSDIAAMGGQPTAVFLSLGLPARIPQRWVDGFMAGFSALARRHGVVLAGGDTAESPRGVIADIIVLGRVPKGQAILRSGARHGDSIYVTGILGASGAVLQALRAGRKLDPRAKTNHPHFFPEPRLKIGEWLRQRGLATAMIDLSDGLSTDLTHICQESWVSAMVDQEALPLVTDQKLKKDLHALNWGEDYELLFTAPARARIPGKIAGTPVTRIGEITRHTKDLVQLRDEVGCTGPLQPRGWQHFRNARQV